MSTVVNCRISLLNGLSTTQANLLIVPFHVLLSKYRASVRVSLELFLKAAEHCRGSMHAVEMFLPQQNHRLSHIPLQTGQSVID